MPLISTILLLQGLPYRIPHREASKHPADQRVAAYPLARWAAVSRGLLPGPAQIPVCVANAPGPIPQVERRRETARPNSWRGTKSLIAICDVLESNALIEGGRTGDQSRAVGRSSSSTNF